MVNLFQGKTPQDYKMQLDEVLLSLYDTHSDKPYIVLNNSVFITEFEIDEKPILFHTGFRFQMHTKSLFDIFFELKTNFIVRQTLSPYYLKVPQIMGYLCSTDKRTFINTVSDSLVTAINNKDTTIDIFGRLVINDLANPETLVTKNDVTEKVTITSDKGTKKTHSSFKIIESKTKSIKLPLQIMFPETVYYDGIRFSKYQPEYSYRRNHFDDDENNSDNWTCDACGADSNTGCMSSTGDCYR
jgi:hypothetical protein